MELHVDATGPREQADRGSVVFIHGFPFDGSMWRAQLEALSGDDDAAPTAGRPDGPGDTGDTAFSGWRGLAPDLRGFGRSPMDGDGCAPTGKRMGAGIALPDEPVLSMACLADDVARLIERESDGPVVVCGLSMGGYVALELHRRRPDLVRALILADTRAEADTDEGRENRMRMAQTVRRSGTEPIARAMVPDLLAEKTRAEQPEVEDAVRAMILGTPPETVIAALAGMACRHDATADLPGIDVPTLVVVGEDDAITPPDTARAMADAIPGAELVVVPGAGHLSPMENPTAFNEALGRLLGRAG